MGPFMNLFVDVFHTLIAGFYHSEDLWEYNPIGVLAMYAYAGPSGTRHRTSLEWAANESLPLSLDTSS